MTVFDNWSHSLRRSFVKDYSLPISVVQDPYFIHQVNTLNDQYKILEKASYLQDMLNEFSNEDEFHKYMRETREKIIGDIKLDHLYTEFISFDLNNSNQIKDHNCSKKIYTQDNVGKDLVSVDLVSANFQVFKILYPKLVKDADNYNDFISNYTDFEYFKKSKKIRQIIFGNLNPKRQQSVIKVFMDRLINKYKDLEDWKLIAKSSDELIFERLNPKVSSIDFLDAPKVFDKTLEVKVSSFKLEKLPNSRIYAKRFGNNSFDLKCCPSNYTIEALRLLNNQKIQPMDRVFFQDGRVCEFKDELFSLQD